MAGEEIAWTSETNWNVIQGDLRKTIHLETSTSLLSKGDEDPTASKLLLLKPLPLPELGPCEITLKFSQKHEIHRVYMRSTARVYEIYYATEKCSENEYLCTVRCGAVEGQDHSFQSDGPAVSTLSDGTKNDHSDEDGWVDVKVSGSVLRDDAYPSLKTSEIKKQEEDTCFYEATAEISDASPCTYLTIRLLSLRTKGSICIDEVYIFADPIEASVFCEPSNPVMSSGNASLLAILVPRLIQLSRSTPKMQEKLSSDSMEMWNGSDMATERRVRMEKLVEAVGKVEQLQPSSGPATKCTSGSTQEESDSVRVHGESSGSASCNCDCEEAQMKLNEKVDKIVAHCASIEESIFRSFVSMETRLKQLEEKLDAVLTSVSNKHANLSSDGSSDEEDDETEKDGHQNIQKKNMVFDRCRRSLAYSDSGFYDKSAAEDDTECDSEEMSSSCSSSDSSSDSDEDDGSEDEDVENEDEENENELDVQSSLVARSEQSCMSCSSDGNSYLGTDDDEAEEDGEDDRNDEHESDDDDTGADEGDCLHGSADALYTITPSSSKQRQSIEAAVVSALSAFVSTASTAAASSIEQGNVASMSINSEGRISVSTGTNLSHSTEELQQFSSSGIDNQDEELLTAEPGHDNASTNSTIFTLDITEEQQLNGVQEDQEEPAEQSEESVMPKPDVGPPALDLKLEAGFGILDYIEEQNLQIKRAFKCMSDCDDPEASLLDVKFVLDKNCQSGLPLEALLGGEDPATATRRSDATVQSSNGADLPSFEESLGSLKDSIDQIDSFSVPEELRVMNSIMEGSAGNHVNGVEKFEQR